MSINLYDKALKEKISKWVTDPKITITDPDETFQLFKYKADTSKDKPLELPLITIRRNRDIEILNPFKKPMSFDAIVIEANKKSVKTLEAIPIDLKYYIDIYTKFLDQNFEYIRNLVFKLVNNPKLEIYIPYNNTNFLHKSKITLLPTISDNSSIPERLILGQFYRYTISIEIDDAYLFSVPVRDTWSINIDNQPEIIFKVENNINEKSENEYGISIHEVDASTP